MIKLIVKDKIVVYVNAELTENYTLLNSGKKDKTTTTNNAFVIEINKLPDYFLPGQWIYDEGKLYPTEEYEKSILDTIKNDAISRIDIITSSNITNGFDYKMNIGETEELLHFSYDSFDQQNFADSANVATLSLSGIEGLPTEVTWNAYRKDTNELVRLTLNPTSFLMIYTAGALVHKATQMEIGGQRKEQIKKCSKITDIQNLLSEWNI